MKISNSVSPPPRRAFNICTLGVESWSIQFHIIHAICARPIFPTRVRHRLLTMGCLSSPYANSPPSPTTWSSAYINTFVRTSQTLFITNGGFVRACGRPCGRKICTHPTGDPKLNVYITRSPTHYRAYNYSRNISTSLAEQQQVDKQ